MRIAIFLLLVSTTVLASEKNGTRIQQRLGKTLDGAEISLGWYDNVKKIECFAQRAGDGKLRCMPTSASVITVVNLYADARCSKQLAVKSQSCTSQKPTFAATPPSGCNSQVQLFEVESLFNGAAYYWSEEKCVRTSLYDELTWYTIGKEILPSEFQEIEPIN